MGLEGVGRFLLFGNQRVPGNAEGQHHAGKKSELGAELFRDRDLPAFAYCRRRHVRCLLKYGKIVAKYGFLVKGGTRSVKTAGAVLTDLGI